MKQATPLHGGQYDGRETGAGPGIHGLSAFSQLGKREPDKQKSREAVRGEQPRWHGDRIAPVDDIYQRFRLQDIEVEVTPAHQVWTGEEYLNVLGPHPRPKQLDVYLMHVEVGFTPKQKSRHQRYMLHVVDDYGRKRDHHIGGKSHCHGYPEYFPGASYPL